MGVKLNREKLTKLVFLFVTELDQVYLIQQYLHNTYFGHSKRRRYAKYAFNLIWEERLCLKVMLDKWSSHIPLPFCTLWWYRLVIDYDNKM